MAMTPEARVKAVVKRTLDEMGIYHFSPFQAGMGRAGIPDIVGCYRGAFFSVECKAGKGKTTALQEDNLQRIRDSGGSTLVINDST
ncbi:hypothetical protein EBT31_19200, partial [bacterium]|nr:hypothetical protein [bacterium]